MDVKTFEEKVKNRANQRVQHKIYKFEISLRDALRLLFGDNWAEINHTKAKEVFLILSGDVTDKGWPKSLWEDERARVQDELFSIMDEMQKTLLSRPPKPEDCTPKE